jgi:hypothetical protein
MSNFLSHKLIFLTLAFVVLDLFAVGAGMGVPIFAILLGFAVGWFTPSILRSAASNLHQLLRMCLTAACLTSGFTFLLMLIIWGPVTRMLLDPSADFENFGIPMILYDPKASFIGWIVLMIVISPFLQAVAGTFASSVRLAWLPPASLRESNQLVKQGS